MPPVYAGNIGIDAFDYLSRRPRRGRIVSRFREGAAALFDDAHDPGLITLQTTRRPLHPWAVDVPEVGSLWRGLPCASDGSCLRIGAQWSLPLNAVRADALTIPGWGAREAQCAFGYLGELEDILDQTPLPADSVPIEAAPLELIPAYFQQRVLDLVIGWGPGSTPSGDDFTVGRLAVLWALADVSPRVVRQIKGLQSVLRWEKLKERTPLGSAQMILSATNGHFCRAISTFVRSLGQAETPSLKASCRPLLSLGATSGTAMLAGIVDGLRRASLWYVPDNPL